jgi:hypothetical protein
MTLKQRLLMQECRVLLFRGLLNPDYDNLFKEIIAKALESEMFVNNRDLGYEFGVSASLVERWLQGHSLPQLESRSLVYRKLQDVIKEREGCG